MISALIGARTCAQERAEDVGDVGGCEEDLGTNTVALTSRDGFVRTVRILC
jgi:hypothetical protein